MAVPKLYCKMENLANIANPEIGVGGDYAGTPTFPPGYVGNGVYIDSDNEYVRFPTSENQISSVKGTFFCYLKMSTAPNAVFERVLFDYHDRFFEGFRFFIKYLAPGPALWQVVVYEGGGVKDFAQFSMNWNIDDVFGIRVMWDETGLLIGGGKTLAIYKQKLVPSGEMDEEEVLMASITTIWTTTVNLTQVYIGQNSPLVQNDQAKLVIDEVRFYDEIAWPEVAPVAEFSGTPTSGYVPLTVQFTDLSTNTPTSWLWNFGDGETSVEENPLHIYDTVGVYTVTLTATNAGGSDSEVKVNYITVLSGDPTSPTDLRLSQCPQEFNPIEIKQGKPRFSAIYNDPNANDIAKYYRIQVNINSSFTGTEMWNSGKTSMDNLDEGERCPEILYQGIELTEDGTTYYWRIKFWDDEDNEGDWSDPGIFTMAGVRRRDSLLLPIRKISLERSALSPIREISPTEREILLPSDN